MFSCNNDDQCTNFVFLHTYTQILRSIVGRSVCFRRKYWTFDYGGGYFKTMMKRTAMSVVTKFFDIWKYVQLQIVNAYRYILCPITTLEWWNVVYQLCNWWCLSYLLYRLIRVTSWSLTFRQKPLLTSYKPRDSAQRVCYLYMNVWDKKYIILMKKMPAV